MDPEDGPGILQDIFELAKKRQNELHLLPTISTASDNDAAIKTLPHDLPKAGLGNKKTFDLVKTHLLPALEVGQAGPRYFGFVTGGTLPPAQYGDFLTTIYDQNAGVNRPAETIASIVEDITLTMLQQLLHLSPETFPGRTLTTGATASNVLGLACARDYAVKQALGDQNYSVADNGFSGISITVFADRAHASLVKAAAVVGIGKNQVVPLDSDLKRFEEQLKEYKPCSGKAAIVSLSYGEVNTGDFTLNVTAIRKLCDKYSIWLHIDAAFGAFARVVPSLEHLANGLELADSITADGHKWLNVPYDCGIFFCRSVEHQQSVFGPPKGASMPAYLKPLEVTESSSASYMEESLAIPSPLNMGIENSRRFRALPLYCALLSLGEKGYAELVERNVAFARSIADWMSSEEGKQLYEVLNLTTIVTSFRPTNPQGASNLTRSINQSRKIYVSPASGAVRIAVSNWSTGIDLGNGKQDDLEIVLETLKAVMTPQ